MDNVSVRRLMTITGVNPMVATAIMAARVPVYGAAFTLPVHLGQAPPLLDGLGGSRHPADGIVAKVRAS
jgi:hypothetical protein